MSKLRLAISAAFVLVIIICAFQITWENSPDNIEDVNHYEGKAVLVKCSYSEYEDRSRYDVKINREIIYFTVPKHRCEKSIEKNGEFHFKGYFIGAFPVLIEMNEKKIIEYDEAILGLNMVFYIAIGFFLAGFIYIQVMWPKNTK